MKGEEEDRKVGPIRTLDDGKGKVEDYTWRKDEGQDLHRRKRLHRARQPLATTSSSKTVSLSVPSFMCSL